MVIKLRGECEKSIFTVAAKGSHFVGLFVFSLSTRTRFLARPDNQQLKWVWIETKRRIRCDCGTDWTAQIEIWKSKWSSIRMEFKRFVSRLIWINLSGLHVVSLNLFHGITGQTRRSYVILVQLLNMLTTVSAVSFSQIVAKWIFVSQFFFRPPSLHNFGSISHDSKSCTVRLKWSCHRCSRKSQTRKCIPN